MSDKLFTIKEAAEHLNVHYQTVRNYIKSGDLPASKVGKNVRIKFSDLESLINNDSNNVKLNELEIRFLTNRRKEIESYLIENDAEVIYHGHVIDHWYTPERIKSSEEKDEWYETAVGYGVRIREQDNGYTGKVTTSLEVKKLVTPYHHEHCIEEEIDVVDYEQASRLLRLMGFKEFITIDKERLIYSHKGFKVVIDDIKDFGVGIEVEIMTEKDRDEVWPELVKYSNSIGLDLDRELVEKSVTYMAMKEMAKF